MNRTGHRWVWIVLSVLAAVLIAFVIWILVLAPSPYMWILLVGSIIVFIIAVATACGMPTIGSYLWGKKD